MFWRVEGKNCHLQAYLLYTPGTFQIRNVSLFYFLFRLLPSYEGVPQINLFSNQIPYPPTPTLTLYKADPSPRRAQYPPCSLLMCGILCPVVRSGTVSGDLCTFFFFFLNYKEFTTVHGKFTESVHTILKASLI